MGPRDRAMLLTSCSVAFRGDSTRSLLLSDLFLSDVMMNAKGLGETIPVSAHWSRPCVSVELYPRCLSSKHSPQVL
jgi:hypothetical protein